MAGKVCAKNRSILIAAVADLYVFRSLKYHDYIDYAGAFLLVYMFQLVDKSKGTFVRRKMRTTA